MTKISIEIGEDLNRQLKQLALDRYGRTHGMQQKIIRDALIAFLNQQVSKPAKEVESIGEVKPQEPIKAKAMPEVKKEMRSVAVPEQTAPREGKALDKHARTLIDLMAESPNNRYTTNELVDMLGLNKTTVIRVMKRAVELDPQHVKMSQGKRRKLLLTYVPAQ